MKIKSYVRKGWQLEEISIEVMLQRGLPKTEILGLPDALIKESVIRIKSAIQTQGFNYPKAQTVLINLQPISERKVSFGLDLPIAVGILMATGQLPCQPWTIYGQLNLDGSVIAPEDVAALSFRGLVKDQLALLTGPTQTLVETPFFAIQTLRQILDLSHVPHYNEFTDSDAVKPQSQKLNEMRFAEDHAHVLAAIAVGEHHAFFAGTPGVGKTTSAAVVHSLLGSVPLQIKQEAFLLSRYFGRSFLGRPFVAPHHTSTPLAIVGGGAKAQPGEITAAHGGLLLLDELLEYPNAVLEALREPFDSGQIRVSRALTKVSYPASCLILATANLCPCGRWIPGEPLDCSYSLRKCRSTLERLSGPLLDRFTICVFLKKSERTISFADLRIKVLEAREFQNQHRPMQTNQSLTENQLMASLEQTSDLKEFLSTQLSGRRRLALLRFARTLADLERSPSIQWTHLQKSKALTVGNFEGLTFG